jgi:hypothetical protein
VILGGWGRASFVEEGALLRISGLVGVRDNAYASMIKFEAMFLLESRDREVREEEQVDFYIGGLSTALGESLECRTSRCRESPRVGQRSGSGTAPVIYAVRRLSLQGGLCLWTPPL